MFRCYPSDIDREQFTYGYPCFCRFICETVLSELLDKINNHRAHRDHRGGLMDYLVHPDVFEEIDNREADPLTGNIIGAAIDVHRALSS